MNSEVILVELVRVAAVFGATWVAVKVELRWLRSDVNRAHKRLNSHDARIRSIGG